jgi:MFS family permease
VVPGVLRNPLVAVCAVFVAFGTYFGAVAVSVADIEDSLDLSHGMFGVLLAVSLFCGGCASALMSVRAHRVGVGRTMRESLFVWTVILVAVVVAPTSWILALLLVVAIGTAGAVDVVMNALATHAVNASPTGLLRVHSTYNLGAAVGAGMAGGLALLGSDWRYVWIPVAVATGLLVLVDWSYFDSDEAGEDEDAVPWHASLRAIVRERLLLVVAAFVIGAVIEGGIDAWGPLYLRVDLDAGAAHGALATSVGYLIGCAGRLSMSTLSDKWGAKWCALLGTSVSACGLLMLVLAPSVSVAAVGLALAVGGITTNWPLLISYATENSANRSLVTGGMSTAGYAGLVVSPAILGGVGSWLGLRSSLATLAVCAVAVVLLVSIMPRRHVATDELQS